MKLYQTLRCSVSAKLTVLPFFSEQPASECSLLGDCMRPAVDGWGLSAICIMCQQVFGKPLHAAGHCIVCSVVKQCSIHTKHQNLLVGIMRQRDLYTSSARCSITACHCLHLTNTSQQLALVSAFRLGKLGRPRGFCFRSAA